MRMIKAPIAGIFFSYQGEGIHIGKPQVFVRFFGCNITCDYCDTKKSSYKLMDVKQVLEKIDRLVKRHFYANLMYRKFNNTEIASSRYCGTRNDTSLVIARSEATKQSNLRINPSISITGGEPLVYNEFLSELLPPLKKNGYEIYLETNGILKDNLKKVNKWVDTIAMDIKLPSACGKAFWKQHKGFLEIGKGKIFVKVVLTYKTKDEEIKRAIDIVRKISVKIPFIFQPATPVKGCKTIKPLLLYSLLRYTKRKLSFVNILPQMHKIWKIK
ncbi:MAG: 7-carboxy-7-deazaguanine synthase QueE [Elusimicrobia bacterium]|nr:7-carboxy-7-deazaguanine synthase QueE [Candidatus Liberimonas magnetica]